MLYQQYKDLKTKYPNALLLMQVGDFFEAFDDDAQTLSDDADQIVLTRRLDGQNVKMAGMPVHMADKYIEMLVLAGHRVAIARKEN